jgi:NAD+ synthase
MELVDKISNWIKQKVGEARAKGCVLGLSGGVDSAVTAILSKRAFPNSTLALILPCHSLKEDVQHAKEFAKKFDIQIKEVDLTSVFETLYIALEGKTYKDQINLCTANLKPRLRMAALYYFANQLNYLVVGTGNKSELTMGYFTKYGDGGVDLLPLGDLTKTEVRKLAAELGVPKEIIDKAPSAGLWQGQTDEGEMGITYAELDRILSGKPEGISLDRLELVKRRETSSQHKRKLPEVFKA